MFAGLNAVCPSAAGDGVFIKRLDAVITRATKDEVGIHGIDGILIAASIDMIANSHLNGICTIRNGITSRTFFGLKT